MSAAASALKEVGRLQNSARNRKDSYDGKRILLRCKVAGVLVTCNIDITVLTFG